MYRKGFPGKKSMRAEVVQLPFFCFELTTPRRVWASFDSLSLLCSTFRSHLSLYLYSHRLPTHRSGLT